jgi:hypothetical protein
MDLFWVLVIVLLFAAVGAFPAWPHSTNWGYGPSSGLGIILLIVILILLLR